MTASLETLLERVPVGLLVVDNLGHIRVCNSHLASMFGYGSDELIGQRVETLIPEEKRKQHALYREAYNKFPDELVMGRGRVLIARRKDSTALQVEVIIDSEDEDETLVTVLEVTERESALEALRESQKINRTGTWSFDLVSNEVIWSKELFRIFELPFSPLAPPYETHKTLFTQESWERLEPAVTAAAENGVPYELELELSKRGTDDVRRFAVARCEPQLDPNGEVNRLVGTFQDITELVSARSDRDEVLERLTLAKSAAGFGIWEWNIEKEHLQWDEQMFEIYGVHGPLTNYDTWKTAVHPEDIVKTEERLYKAVAQNAIFKNTFRIIRHGELRHIMAFAITSSTRIIGVNMDITEQVRLREEARRINNLDSLGALAGGIAHDFNNQLASIGARSELLALKPEDPLFVQRVAQELKHAVESASKLTKQLLTFAKGGAPVRESASIEELLRENVEFSSRGTSLSVAFSFDSDLWNVNVDPHQIGQVIQNIVINAVQAMPAAGGLLGISARNQTIDSDHAVLKAGNYIELKLEDNGPGIPEQAISRVFDPYYTTKAEGHGLGLAICHSIITQHDGNISISSRPGLGTQFSILLPATTEPTRIKRSALTPSAGSGKVLVVDDMPDVLQMMGEMVQALGYRCEMADSVEEALKLFRSAQEKAVPFDMVITDLTMPGSAGGFDVFREVRLLDPGVKVIIASGYASDPASSKADALGFAGQLEKPFTLSELANELNRVSQQALAGQAETPHRFSNNC